MLGSSLTAVFLVMKHHLKEIGLTSLEKTAPFVLLTCLSFLPRTSRLPRATCNNILASVLTKLSQMLQVGQPSTTAHVLTVGCAVSSALTIETRQSWDSLVTLRTHGAMGSRVSLLAHFAFLSLETYETAQHMW